MVSTLVVAFELDELTVRILSMQLWRYPNCGRPHRGTAQLSLLMRELSERTPALWSVTTLSFSFLTIMYVRYTPSLAAAQETVVKSKQASSPSQLPTCAKAVYSELLLSLVLRYEIMHHREIHRSACPQLGSLPERMHSRVQEQSIWMFT